MLGFMQSGDVLILDARARYLLSLIPTLKLSQLAVDQVGTQRDYVLSPGF